MRSQKGHGSREVTQTYRSKISVLRWLAGCAFHFLLYTGCVTRRDLKSEIVALYGKSEVTGKGAFRQGAKEEAKAGCTASPGGGCKPPTREHSVPNFVPCVRAHAPAREG